MKLQGIFAELTTPFDSSGEIYKTKIQHNVEKWNRVGLAGYLVCGPAGEGAMLSAEEEELVWSLVAQHAAPEKVLMAGIAAESVRETVDLIKRAARAGYKAAVVEAPRHYQYSQEDRSLYFRTVADRIPIPLVARGSSHAWDHPNILDALADDAANLWSALQGGATRAVLALASAAPYACIALWEAHRTREEEAGLDWQARMAPAECAARHIGALKYAMDLNGYYGGPPRLPLPLPSAAQRRQVEETFKDLKG